MMFARARRQMDIVLGAAITLILSAVMINLDLFEKWHEFTRTHEHMEIDELLSVLIAFLCAGNIISIRRNIHLKRVFKELTWSQDKLRQLEKERVIQEKMAALGKLSSGISHEISNALQPILGLSQIMRARLGKKDKKMNECLDMIEKNTLYMREIIQKVMEVSRSGAD
ncbi:MAG: hypothetical protein COY40_05135, partial [Alphaproteobacteria bacterium CG_4_10_14_0_8_um_filter_53_9]